MIQEFRLPDSTWHKKLLNKYFLTEGHKSAGRYKIKEVSLPDLSTCINKDTNMLTQIEMIVLSSLYMTTDIGSEGRNLHLSTTAP